MNGGIITQRYANALLMYADETGNGDKLYSQITSLLQIAEELQALKDYIQKGDLTNLQCKFLIMETALAEPLCPELRRFVQVVERSRRTEYFLRMLRSFTALYRKSRGIKLGKLVTARPSENLKEKLEIILHEKTGAEVRLETEVDPEIIGGFVFELDDWRLDASVQSRLKALHRELIDKNNRIV